MCPNRKPETVVDMAPREHGADANPPAAYTRFPLESELVVAIFRTALILLAGLASFLGVTTHAMRLAMGASVGTAAIYNLIVIILAARRVYLPGQRRLMLVLDILLVTTWVYFTWGSGPFEAASPLFPFYYVLLIVSALWFGVMGAVTAAASIAVLYLGLVYLVSGMDAMLMVDAIYRQVVYLFLVALISGYVVDTHKREREQWTRSQVLLAQYQERFRAAQEMYELLVPAQAPRVPGLDLGARWRPALQEGGGDFYDVVQLASGRVVIAIADVSGKFTRGAIKLPLFKAAFLATAQVWDDPGQVLSQVNRIVYPLLQPDMFISACVLTIDMAHRRLYYANAGQDPPVFVRDHTRKTVLLETGGLVLGVDQDAAYPTEEQRLEPGDTLCLYTDGVVEARSPEGTEFGYGALEARVQAGVAVGLRADAIADNIFEAVNEHIRGGRRHDDTTLVVIRFRPEAEAVDGETEPA